jgi:hypothetical protein
MYNGTEVQFIAKLFKHTKLKLTLNQEIDYSEIKVHFITVNNEYSGVYWFNLSVMQKPIHHLVVCLTTGPNPLRNWAVHIVRSSASSFKWQYPLLSLRSSGSFLLLLPHFPFTSIPPFIFPSITCFRRQFLHKSNQSS